MTSTEPAPQGPVPVLHFRPAPRALDLAARSDPARRAGTICARANRVREAVEQHRDELAVRLAEVLARCLQRAAADRRDRPAFLHGALLDRAARALEEAAWDREPTALAEAREWLHAVAASTARGWALRAGIAGPLSERECAALRAVRGSAALLESLARPGAGEAVPHAEQVAGELARAGRRAEAASLRMRAGALESRLSGLPEPGRDGGAEIAAAARALEEAALRVLGTMDPGDLRVPLGPQPSAGPLEAGRHAVLGLQALGRKDLAALADEAMAAAAHLRAPACVEAGWSQWAEDLLDRVEGLRACLERRDDAAALPAALRVEAALARIGALEALGGGAPSAWLESAAA